MAAAYAALVSLLNNLENIQNHPRHSFSFDNNQIQSLVKSVTFLIEFMESYDNSPSCPSKDAAQLLERRITCAAQAAEQVIESHIVDQIRGGSTLGGSNSWWIDSWWIKFVVDRLLVDQIFGGRSNFLQDVEKVNQDMDCVMREAIKIQRAQRDGVNPKRPTYSAPASSSTQLLTSEKTVMVGFDDLLLQLLDVLTGHLTSRRVIPIVGTGGVGNYALVNAPNEIWEMIQLRHLEVNIGIHLPDPPPSDQGKGLVMRNLHTLMLVDNLMFSEEFCKRVPNVKELEARYYIFNEARSYYCPHNLGCLSNLESLRLCIEDGDGNSTCCKFSLRSWSFPSSLKKLDLFTWYMLAWEEMTMMVGSLPHLETLCFGSESFGSESDSVIGSEWTLVEGKFLRLKSLTIWSRDLVKWNVDNSHFPVLENLILRGMNRLDELPLDIGTIPTLRSITLDCCNVSLAISAMRMLVEQEEDGNEGLRLNVTFYDGSKLKSFNKMLEEEGLASNNLRLNDFLFNL